MTIRVMIFYSKGGNKLPKLSTHTLIVMLFIVFALVGGIMLFINIGEERNIAEIDQFNIDLENAIEQRNYTYALELLEENELTELQEHTNKDLERLKRSLPTAIELENVFNEDKGHYIDKLAELRYKLEDTLYEQANERYSTIIDEYISSENYEEIERLSAKGYIDQEYLSVSMVEKAEKFLFDHNLIMLINNNQFDEITMKTAGYDEGTIYNHIYHLCAAIEEDPQNPGGVTANLVYIPKGYSEFPQPFQEKYDALMNKYGNTKDYEIALMVRESNERQKRKNNITTTIKVGMTTLEVQSLLGNPTDINTTVNSFGKSEQWVYRDYNGSKYVYFENGIVTSISG